MKKYKYEEMYPHEFLEAVKTQPVFFVPTGLLEWHADHLPLGLDGLKAYAICEKIIQKLEGGILLPINYFGRPGFSTYIGTLTYSEGCMHILFNELFNQLKKVGAKVIVLLTGHYGPSQMNCIKRIAETFNKENQDVKVIAFAEYEDIIIDGVIPCDHAGLFETSIYWHLFPEKFDNQKINLEIKDIKIYENPPYNFYNESQNWTWSNDVKKSSKELGKMILDQIVEKTVKKIWEELEYV